MLLSQNHATPHRSRRSTAKKITRGSARGMRVMAKNACGLRGTGSVPVNTWDLWSVGNVAAHTGNALLATIHTISTLAASNFLHILLT